MATKRVEAKLQLDGGASLPQGAAAGLLAGTDASGNITWRSLIQSDMPPQVPYITNQLGAGNGTDDTTAINNALAGGGRVRGRAGETYHISTPLVIPSNTELDMTGCTIAYASGISAVFNMLKNSCVSPATTATDVSTTVGSAVVTSATLAAVAQVGQVLAVVGAGPQGGNTSSGPNNIWLYGTVQSISGNNITLTSKNINGIAANSTGTNQTGYLFNRDSNITVIGGTWDGGTAYSLGGGLPGRNANWTSFNSHQLRFRRVDGLTVRGTTLKLTSFPAGGGWVFGINPADCTDVLVDSPTGVGSSTVVQGDGPLDRVTIRNVRGSTQDDMVAFGSVDFQGNDTEGDITGLLVDGIDSNGSWTAFKAFSGLGSNGVQRYVIGTVRSVRGSCTNGPVNINDYSGAGSGVCQISFEDIQATSSYTAINNTGANGRAQYPVSPYTPDQSGFLASTCDPLDTNGTYKPGSGVLTVMAIRVPFEIVIANLITQIMTAGATLTSAQNLMGVYDPQGRMGTPGGLIAKTADQSATWNSTGFKVMALAAQSGYSLTLPGGPGVFYWVALLSVGTTPPTFPAKAGTIDPHLGFSQGVYAATVPGAKHRTGYMTPGGQTSLVSLNGKTITDSGMTTMPFVGVY